MNTLCNLLYSIWSQNGFYTLLLSASVVKLLKKTWHNTYSEVNWIIFTEWLNNTIETAGYPVLPLVIPVSKKGTYKTFGLWWHFNILWKLQRSLMIHDLPVRTHQWVSIERSITCTKTKHLYLTLLKRARTRMHAHAHTHAHTHTHTHTHTYIYILPNFK